MSATSENIPVYSLHNFSSGEKASQQFQVEVFDANRHFSVKYPHRHDFFEVLYLSVGSGYHVIDGNKYAIRPPSVFFMSPGQAHKVEFSKDIDGYIFIFTADFYLINQSNQNRLIEFPFFFNIQQENPPLQLREERDILFLEGLFQRGVSELKKENQHSDSLLRSILDLILTTCAALYPRSDHAMNSVKGHIVVKKFLQLVEENVRNNLSVAQYAERMAITPSHLTQTINRLTGKTSLQIIKSKQILEIKRLLVHTNLNATEIASALNFPDQSYFTRFFKRETGLTPLQYRASSL